MSDEIFPPITAETKLELIKRAISSEAGWRALAQAIVGSTNPNAKQETIAFLKHIANEKEVELPTIEGGPVKVKFADLLVQQLEYNIALAEATKEDK